jgi:hypothetical protein
LPFQTFAAPLNVAQGDSKIALPLFCHDYRVALNSV